VLDFTLIVAHLPEWLQANAAEHFIGVVVDILDGESSQCLD
jgi:hypothetical protein